VQVVVWGDPRLGLRGGGGLTTLGPGADCIFAHSRPRMVSPSSPPSLSVSLSLSVHLPASVS
jgi:hypothetical protein